MDSLNHFWPRKVSVIRLREVWEEGGGRGKKEGWWRIMVAVGKEGQGMRRVASLRYFAGYRGERMEGRKAEGRGRGGR